MSRFSTFHFSPPPLTSREILNELCTYVYDLFKDDKAFFQLPPQYLYCPEHCKRWYDGVRVVCDRWICSDVALIISQYSFAPSSEMVFFNSIVRDFWYPTETIVRAFIDITPVLPMIVLFFDLFSYDTCVTVYFGTASSFYHELSTNNDPIGFLYNNALCTCQDYNGYYHPVHATLKLISAGENAYVLECANTGFRRTCSVVGKHPKAINDNLDISVRLRNPNPDCRGNISVVSFDDSKI